MIGPTPLTKLLKAWSMMPSQVFRSTKVISAAGPAPPIYFELSCHVSYCAQVNAYPAVKTCYQFSMYWRLDAFHSVSCLQMSAAAAATTVMSPSFNVGKGRGLVLTEDVKAGQLLLVSNPLAIAHVDANDFGFQIDLQTRRMVCINKKVSLSHEGHPLIVQRTRRCYARSLTSTDVSQACQCITDTQLVSLSAQS